MTSLTKDDINTIAKLNAIIEDGDIPSDAIITEAINSIKGNVPEGGDTLAKLYSIIQGLGNLKKEDIDTLAELNEILTDADLVNTSELSLAISALVGGVPEAGSTLAKLYNLLGGKKDKYADTYLNTYFVSPNVAGGSGIKGDYMMPFTPDEAYQLAGNGDTIAFLPGVYYMVGNMAKNGVAYTTFGGRALLVTGGFNLFDYESLDDAASPITIDGDFEFSNSGGTIFNFKNGTIPRKYIIRWSEASHYGGAIMRMPTVLSTGIFEGNIELSQDCMTAAIECSDSAMTTGAGIMNLTIINNSQLSFAIKPWFSGFRFNISYVGTAFGLFAQPIGTGSDNNLYSLNIKQGVTCTTYLTSGQYSGTIQGGLIFLYQGAIHLDARLDGCELHVSPDTSSKVIAVANTVSIFNDQPTMLKLDGVWHNSTYDSNTQASCIMAGEFYALQINTSVGQLKITGNVRLKEGTSALVRNTDILEVAGKLIANASEAIQLAENGSVVISGYIKQLDSSGRAISFLSEEYTIPLTLKNAIIQSGSLSQESIFADAPIIVDLRLYGRSYSNKSIGGSSQINYLIGGAGDFVIDSDINIVDL